MATLSDSHAAAAPQSEQPMLEAKVWDVPTRIFHWSLVALVAIAWASGEEEGYGFIIHSIAGYAVIVALLFRIVWGFVGGAYARFNSFLAPWSTTLAYGKQLLRFKPPRCVGHNPLGGWMVILLLAVLALLTVSGLFAQGDEGVAGPWAQAAVGLSAHQWYELHEVLFNVLLLLVAIHIAGVVLDQILTGDKLVRAMFSGVKRVSQRDRLSDRVSVGATRAWLTLAAAVIVTGFLVGWQLPSATDTEARRSQEDAHEDERGERQE